MEKNLWQNVLFREKKFNSLNWATLTNSFESYFIQIDIVKNKNDEIP